MSAGLTIAWLTSRRDACFDWFCDSLHRECGGAYDGISVIAVDYWANPFGCTPEMHEDRRAYILQSLRCRMGNFKWIAPKPNPWQGPYRQTREDWFAAASARNTAVCFCETDWLAFVDDLSVLQPGWLAEVHNAMRFEKTVTCGSYRKVKDLLVVNGEVAGFKPHLIGEPGKQTDAGMDSRLQYVANGQIAAHAKASLESGSWLFGCSCAMPLEALLQVNGWDERCDGMGAEDTNTGINLAKKGWRFRYAPGMATLESEERHGAEPKFKCSDYGVSPNDKSHAMVALCLNGNGVSPVKFGNSDLRMLRTRVLERQPFPQPPRDMKEWYTGKLLAEL